MDKPLTLKDYINMPILELMEHDDFDENFFWLAVALFDAPMTQLAGGIDHEWLKSIKT